MDGEKFFKTLAPSNLANNGLGEWGKPEHVGPMELQQIELLSQMVHETTNKADSGKTARKCLDAIMGPSAKAAWDKKLLPSAEKQLMVLQEDCEFYD